MADNGLWAHIVGTGSITPKRILSNKDLEKIVDTSDDWITRRSGIKERRISSNGRHETTTDMGTQASRRALEMAGMSPQDLDMIIVGTVTGDRHFPSTGCMVQKDLDAPNAAAFDVSAGCTGFLYALTMAHNAIRTGMVKNALVVGAERLSSITNWTDRGTCVLLADGAGAVVLSCEEEKGGVLSNHMKSDGSQWELLYSSDGNFAPPEILNDMDSHPFHLKMEGSRIFKQAIERMTTAAKEALAYNGLTMEDIALAISSIITTPWRYWNGHMLFKSKKATRSLSLSRCSRSGCRPGMALNSPLIKVIPLFSDGIPRYSSRSRTVLPSFSFTCRLA